MSSFQKIKKPHVTERFAKLSQTVENENINLSEERIVEKSLISIGNLLHEKARRKAFLTDADLARIAQGVRKAAKQSDKS